MKKNKSNDVNNVKWSQPMSVKGLSLIFDNSARVGYNADDIVCEID